MTRQLFGSVFAALVLGASLLGGCSSTDANAGLGGASGGGDGGPPPGCTQTPDCNSCTACFDACLCAGGDAALCLSQCSAGSGGVGAGGSGGFGAGGGTGGTPSGGSGGVPSGGSGGVGAGGSGGGGTCPVQVQTGSPACDQCVMSACCSQLQSCFGSQACAGLNNCIGQYCSNAQDINACVNQFCSQYGAGASAFNAMVQCFSSSCAGSC